MYYIAMQLKYFFAYHIRHLESYRLRTLRRTRARRVKITLRTSCDCIPRVPATPQANTRLIPGPERSYGSLPCSTRCEQEEEWLTSAST